MQKQTAKIMVKRARYFPEEKSILIVGQEVHTGKSITQQALVKDFVQEFGLTVQDDDHDAWRFFAKQLETRNSPIELVFLGTKTEADQI